MIGLYDPALTEKHPWRGKLMEESRIQREEEEKRKTLGSRGRSLVSSVKDVQRVSFGHFAEQSILVKPAVPEPAPAPVVAAAPTYLPPKPLPKKGLMDSVSFKPVHMPMSPPRTPGTPSRSAMRTLGGSRSEGHVSFSSQGDRCSCSRCGHRPGSQGMGGSRSMGFDTGASAPPSISQYHHHQPAARPRPAAAIPEESDDERLARELEERHRFAHERHERRMQYLTEQKGVVNTAMAEAEPQKRKVGLWDPALTVKHSWYGRW